MMRTVLAVVTAGVLTALLAVGSQFPYTAERDDAARLRLSWRTRGVRVEECRRLTPDELAALPAHMRREEVCEGRGLPYRLEVWVDAHAELSTVIQPAGARGDSPLFVNEEIRLPPGAHEVEVVFAREAGADSALASDATGVPPRLEWRASLDPKPREITLVTYDPALRRLIALERR